MANSFQNEQDSPEIASLAELAENIVYRLPGCADVVVRKTLREVYREFCRETKCLTAECRIPLEKGVCVYPVPTAFGGTVESVRSVAVDDRELVERRDYRLDHANRVFLLRDYANVPSDGAYDGIEDGSFRVDRIHTGEAHVRPSFLRVTFVEQPRMESEKTPRWFVERHGDAIVDGVLAKLSKDERLAAESRLLYENAKSEERMRREYPGGRNCIDTSMVL